MRGPINSILGEDEDEDDYMAYTALFVRDSDKHFIAKRKSESQARQTLS
jgi:hypothetical protein